MSDPAPTSPNRDQRREALESLTLDKGSMGPRRRRRLPGGLVFVLVVAGLVGAWMVFQGVTAVPTVRTASVLRSSPVADREITTANGYVVARTRASVASKTQGRLARVLVDEGDVVTDGQLLGVIEHDDLDAGVAEAQAMLEKSRRGVPAGEAALRESEAALATAGAGLAERRAAVVEAEAVLAERESSYRRTEELVQREIQSAADLDRAREARDVAAARVTLAETALATAEIDVERSKASVEVSRQQLEMVRHDVGAADASLARTQAVRENAFIRAPFAGMVLRREAEPGEVVSPANTGASGSKTAVVTLADFATLEIEVDVYERDIAKVGVDTPCRVVLDAYPDRRQRGRVRLLRPTADRTRATIQVYVVFEAVPDFARPEMGARVTFYEPGTDVLAPDTLSVPAAAATARDGKAGAFVLAGRSVRFRAAEFGEEHATDDGPRRIVLSGLQSGETVVVEPGPELLDGARVAVDES